MSKDISACLASTPLDSSSSSKLQDISSDEEDSKTRICSRTRYHHLSSSSLVEQTLHMAIVVGKTQDPVVSAEWLKKSCGDEGMYQSDEALGHYIALHYPHIKVTILRPKLHDIPKMAEKLAGCDVVHIIESEQFLGHHNYSNYRKMFQVLQGLGTKLRPSLETMQFIMSKVDYIKLMEENNIPHVPTFFVERPSDFTQLQKSLTDMVAWLKSLQPIPKYMVTKPSHSGSKLHFESWSVATLGMFAKSFVCELKRLFLTSQKPYVLVQPFLQGLADQEYRLYFINGKFISCVSTIWGTNFQGKANIKRDSVDDPALLSQLRPIAQKAVDLLPRDSALYRVDMFCHNCKYAINEIEMVDADLMPEYHIDDVDIIKLFGEAVVQMGVVPPDRGSMISVLPVIDSGMAIAGSLDDWRKAVATLRECLRTVDTIGLGLEAEDKAQLHEWVNILEQLFSTQELAELCNELGLFDKGSKRNLAATVGMCIMQQEAEGLDELQRTEMTMSHKKKIKVALKTKAKLGHDKQKGAALLKRKAHCEQVMKAQKRPHK